MMECNRYKRGADSSGVVRHTLSQSRWWARATAGTVLVLLALLLSGMPVTGHAAGPRAAANVYVEGYVDSALWFKQLDPAKVISGYDSAQVQKIYAGLVKQVYNRPTGTIDVAPDLAAEMPRLSKGGRVYTFTLRQDARFSDGSPVTAQDVVYSLNRALAPAEASPVAAAFFGDIMGAGAVASGSARTCSGLKALGPATVQITLTHPASYFLATLTTPAGFIVKHAVPVGADLTRAPVLIVGAGPFMIKPDGWQYHSQAALVPNPYYYNAKNIKLAEIRYLFLGSSDAAFASYRSGALPMVQLPAAEVARFRGKPEFHESPLLDVQFLVMNVRVKPFDNLHLRRAVAFALNRDAIVNGVNRGTVQPLAGWYPKGILGYDAGVGTSVPHYDLGISRHELALAIQEIGTTPTAIPLSYPAEVGMPPVLQQVQRDLKVVGLAVSLHAVPGQALLRALSRTAFVFSDWGADYPDPQDYSEVIQGAGFIGPYRNPRLNALYARAATVQDPALRQRLYAQAQRLLLNDAPIAVLFQSANQWAISPNYHGLELEPGLFSPWPVGSDWANVTVSP